VIKSRKIRWAEQVAGTRGRKVAYRVLVGRPRGNRPLGRHRHRWHDIKMDLQEVGWEGMDSIDLSQDRHRWRAFVNVVMNLRVA
jgi:hypothetical protein